jgi:hypothetical protein
MGLRNLAALSAEVSRLESDPLGIGLDDVANALIGQAVGPVIGDGEIAGLHLLLLLL